MYSHMALSRLLCQSLHPRLNVKWTLSCTLYRSQRGALLRPVSELVTLQDLYGSRFMFHHISITFTHDIPQKLTDNQKYPSITEYDPTQLWEIKGQYNHHLISVQYRHPLQWMRLCEYSESVLHQLNRLWEKQGYISKTFLSPPLIIMLY